jgi:uncharacterized protein YjbI with pentapeptide repeats
VPQAPPHIEWDEDAFKAALKGAEQGMFDVRGVRVSADQLQRLLNAAPQGAANQPELVRADFRDASFSGPADFHRASFSGPADFAEASFSGPAVFYGASFTGLPDFAGASFTEQANFYGASFTGPSLVNFDGASLRNAFFQDASFTGLALFAGASFSGRADFAGASFNGDAQFGKACFNGDALFVNARFSGEYANFAEASFSRDAHFAEASFSEHALFDRASFNGPARFHGASFDGPAQFGEASFGGPASFGGARFSGLALLGEAKFSGNADFSGARFEQAKEWGPLFVGGRTVLDRAVFAQPVRIELRSRELSCARAVFREGVDAFVGGTAVSLEAADFGAPSLVAALPVASQPPQPDLPSDDSRSRVVSLRRAKAADLTLSGVDLHACRFLGAHGLDQLKLERVEFASPPEGWRWLPRLRWTRRQTVAEEHHWRNAHNRDSGWYEDDVRAPDWLPDTDEPPDAEQVADVYRALRKGREDSKDEPGAADFYYGEMEMRRLANGPRAGRSARGRATSRAERLLVTVYWALSGYGLRASRAVAALLLVIALFTAGFHLYGFRDRVRPYATNEEVRTARAKAFPPSPGDLVDSWASLEAWTYTAGTATAVIGAPEAQLTQAGRGMRIVLRILGPILIGLALLAIRGRVKR